MPEMPDFAREALAAIDTELATLEARVTVLQQGREALRHLYGQEAVAPANVARRSAPVKPESTASRGRSAQTSPSRQPVATGSLQGRRDALDEAVIGYLRRVDEPSRVKDLCRGINRDVTTVRASLDRLEANGVLRRVGKTSGMRVHLLTAGAPAKEAPSRG